MKTNQHFKSYSFVFKESIGVLLIFFISSVGYAQFNLIGTKGPSGINTSIVLKTLHIPGEDKRTNFELVFNDYKNTPFPSGTLLETPANTMVSLEYKGQIQVLQPNSKLTVQIVKKGVIAQLIAGELQNIFAFVKQRVGFYKVGNGYTWAFAEGTTFWIEANPNSKKATFRTEKDSEITIVENRKVTFGGNSTYDIGRQGRSQDIYGTISQTLGSNSSYDAGNDIVFSSNQEALEFFLNEIENGGYEYEEQLDDFLSVVELYLAEDDIQNAEVWMSKIIDRYFYEVDPGFYLLHGQVLYELGNYEKAIAIVNLFLNLVDEEINFIEDDCELADYYENLGWAYDLLGDTSEADRNYALSDSFSCSD